MYARQTWVDGLAGGTPVSAARLNVMEAGIEGAVQRSGGDTIEASAAGVIPLVLQGAVGQTADLLDIVNSAGTRVVLVDAAGGVSLDRNGTAGTAVGGLDPLAGVGLTVAGGGAARKPLVVRGAASQTANLAEFQDSSATVRAAVNWYGGIEGRYGILAGAVAALRDTLGSTLALGVQPLAPGDRGLIVRGAASQTANLQEWQSSGGTLLSRVTSGGRIVSGDGGDRFGGGAVTADVTSAYAFVAEISGSGTVGLTVRARDTSSIPFRVWDISNIEKFRVDSAGDVYVRGEKLESGMKILGSIENWSGNSNNYTSLFTFVAPASGRVVIHGTQYSNASNHLRVSVNGGSTLYFLVGTLNSSTYSGSGSVAISGLTPGSTYTVTGNTNASGYTQHVYVMG